MNDKAARKRLIDFVMISIIFFAISGLVFILLQVFPLILGYMEYSFDVRQIGRAILLITFIVIVAALTFVFKSKG